MTSSQLAGEHLALARKASTAATLGVALREYAAIAVMQDRGVCLTEVVSLLETTPARYFVTATASSVMPSAV